MPWVIIRTFCMLQDGVMKNVPPRFNHCVRNHVRIAHSLTVNLINNIDCLIFVFLECPAGWEQELIHGTPGENCYKISNDKRTWDEAQKVCATTGGHLAHIEDDTTNAFYDHLVDNYMLPKTQINNCLLGKAFKDLVDRILRKKTSKT